MAFYNTLIDMGILTQDELSVMEKRINDEIDEAFVFAKESPLPTHKNLHNYLFCER